MIQNLPINGETKIRKQILAYLTDHPSAQDTLEGIVEWWLLEQEVKFETARVKKALFELVTKGLVFEKKGPDSRIHYRINQSKYREIQRLRKKDE